LTIAVRVFLLVTYKLDDDTGQRNAQQSGTCAASHIRPPRLALKEKSLLGYGSSERPFPSEFGQMCVRPVRSSDGVSFGQRLFMTDNSELTYHPHDMSNSLHAKCCADHGQKVRAWMQLSRDGR